MLRLHRRDLLVTLTKHSHAFRRASILRIAETEMTLRQAAFCHSFGKKYNRLSADISCSLLHKTKIFNEKIRCPRFPPPKTFGYGVFSLADFEICVKYRCTL